MDDTITACKNYTDLSVWWGACTENVIGRVQLILCISCVALCQCVSMNVHTYLWAVNWSASLCVCMCFTVTCTLVCVYVNKPLFVCGFGWRPLPLLLSEYGQVAVYVWMWHLCAVILLCGLPMLHRSKRLSLHHWHTRGPGVQAIFTFCCSLIIHSVNYRCTVLHHPKCMWK